MKKNLEKYMHGKGLRKGHAKRKMQAKNLHSAASIAILGFVSEKKDIDFFQDFAKHLKETYELQKLEIFLWVADKKLYADLEQKYKVDTFLFTLKDWTWLGKPKNRDLLRFTQEPYDILMNLCGADNQNNKIRYLLASSQASFKIGKSSPEFNEFYDLSVEYEQKSIKMFTELLMYYVQLIDNKNGSN